MAFSLGKSIDIHDLGTVQRVLEKTEVDEETGCLNWTGAYSVKHRGTRPVIRIGGKKSRVVQVARLMLEWKDGPPPSPLHEAGHTCPAGENARCVNQAHLTWQTRTENEHHKWRYKVPEESQDSRPATPSDQGPGPGPQAPPHSNA